MTTRHDKPADTTMMGVVHDALRRDLARLQAALPGSPPPGDVQRRALAGHIDWMMDFLHHHHHGEDTGLWPLLRQPLPILEGAFCMPFVHGFVHRTSFMVPGPVSCRRKNLSALPGDAGRACRPHGIGLGGRLRAQA